MKKNLTHLSLFTGVGGLDIAAERAGFMTIGQCEWADYPRKILQKHWPEVPRWKDITTLTKDDFYAKTGKEKASIISGGFPCQPFSHAGNRKGFADDRYLWPEMLRVITELQPNWVIGENVDGIISMALDQTLSDLENAGYATRAFVIPAVAVSAPHQRNRVAIIGYRGKEKPKAITTLANSDYYRDLWRKFNSKTLKKATRHGYYNKSGVLRVSSEKWWSREPGVGRVAYGIPARMDRLKCLGNAVVPYQFHPIFKAISIIESLL